MATRNHPDPITISLEMRVQEGLQRKALAGIQSLQVPNRLSTGSRRGLTLLVWNWWKNQISSHHQFQTMWTWRPVWMRIWRVLRGNPALPRRLYYELVPRVAELPVFSPLLLSLPWLAWYYWSHSRMIL